MELSPSPRSWQSCLVSLWQRMYYSVMNQKRSDSSSERNCVKISQPLRKKLASSFHQIPLRDPSVLPNNRKLKFYVLSAEMHPSLLWMNQLQRSLAKKQKRFIKLFAISRNRAQPSFSFHIFFLKCLNSLTLFRFCAMAILLNQCRLLNQIKRA